MFKIHILADHLLYIFQTISLSALQCLLIDHKISTYGYITISVNSDTFLGWLSNG